MIANTVKGNVSELVFLDLETSGFDPKIHDMLEVGLLVTDTSLRVLNSWDAKIVPMNISTANPASLLLNGYNEAQWNAEAIVCKDVLAKIASICAGRTIVGHNIHFDMSFLEHACDVYDVQPTWDHWPIDTKSICWFLGLENTSLDALCQRFDITIPGHRALNDCYRALALMKALKRFK